MDANLCSETEPEHAVTSYHRARVSVCVCVVRVRVCVGACAQAYEDKCEME